MSVWRRRAIESFPELRRELNDRREIATVYGLWIEHLLPLWVNAHTSGNDETLARVYSFADWCSQQRAHDLWNSAGVCFYEHVLDHGSWETVLPRLSDAAIRDVWALWEYRLREADIARLRTLLHEQNRSVPAPGAGITRTDSRETAPRPAQRGRSRRGTRPRRDQRP